jgi:hypothetical protein
MAISAVASLLGRLSAHLPCKVIKGPGGAPFLERYHLLRIPVVDFQLVLHRFVASDPARGFHEHPWLFGVLLILAGSYDQLRMARIDAPPSSHSQTRRTAGSIEILESRSLHRVLLDPGDDAWTLFNIGPRYKRWGFAAVPAAHRYPDAPADGLDHYNRRRIQRRSMSAGDAFYDSHEDINFRNEGLEYRE